MDMKTIAEVTADHAFLTQRGFKAKRAFLAATYIKDISFAETWLLANSHRNVFELTDDLRTEPIPSPEDIEEAVKAQNSSSGYGTSQRQSDNVARLVALNPLCPGRHWIPPGWSYTRTPNLNNNQGFYTNHKDIGTIYHKLPSNLYAVQHIMQREFKSDNDVSDPKDGVSDSLEDLEDGMSLDTDLDSSSEKCDSRSSSPEKVPGGETPVANGNIKAPDFSGRVHVGNSNVFDAPIYASLFDGRVVYHRAKRDGECWIFVRTEQRLFKWIKTVKDRLQFSTVDKLDPQTILVFVKDELSARAAR